MYNIVRKGLLGLSRSTMAQDAILALPVSRTMARRFVAGEEIEDALRAVEALNKAGMQATLDHLGENISRGEEAQAAGNVYLEILQGVKRKGLASGVSVKPTHLGLELGEQTAYGNIKRIASQAALQGRFVRIDMEGFQHLEATLSLYRRLRRDFANVGIVIQAYLRRSLDDIESLVQEGIGDVRLVKGAYQEPPSVAYQDRQEIRDAFIEGMRVLWSDRARSKRARAAIASHDLKIIDAAKVLSRKQGISPADFEFQFLYGVRRDLAATIVGQGYRMRQYVPFGTSWYGYFMRRIAERPANLLFFLRALVGR